MNIAQIKRDLDSGVMVCSSTWRELVEWAVKVEAEVGANPMITSALAAGEDTTGLCTVREWAEMAIAPCAQNPLGQEGLKHEMAFISNGLRYVVEMTVTQCENVSSTTGEPK